MSWLPWHFHIWIVNKWLSYDYSRKEPASFGLDLLENMSETSIAHNLTMPVSADISDKASVFIRIRPENKKERQYKSKGHEKYLADYNDTSVTMGGRKVGPNTKQYDFPKLVLGPDCDQQEAYEKLGMENLLDNFLFNNQDACILAYGQTGKSILDERNLLANKI